MAKSKPTVVFFAGAFADPSCFDQLATIYHDAGYPTSYAYVPTLNPKELEGLSTKQDAEATRSKVLLPLIEGEHKEVVVFCHSYGGVVGGAASAGLGKSTRADRGEAGGVIGLVYCVGNIVGDGETLKEAVGGAYPPFIKIDKPKPTLALIEPAMDTLYGDVDPSLAPDLEAKMIPHSLAAFETPSSAPAWAEPGFEGRRLYIRTLKDQCNPLFLQDIWIEKSGVKWETVDLESSHCPFISHPNDVAAATVPFMEKWA